MRCYVRQSERAKSLKFDHQHNGLPLNGLHLGKAAGDSNGDEA